MACEGCKERDKGLTDGWTRRGFIGATVGLLAVIKVQAYQAITGDTEIPFELAIGLTRTIITNAIGLFQVHDKFQPKEVVLSPEGVLKHKAHTEIGSPMATYMNTLKVDENGIVQGTEIVPGWELDWDGNEDGFKAILKNKRTKIIFDDTGVIYCADTLPGQPTAKMLHSAREFPGAIGYLRYQSEHDKVSMNSIKSRFRRMAYAVPSGACNNCPGYGCLYCVQQCCAMICYNRFPPPAHTCWFTCGNGPPDCGGPGQPKCCTFGYDTTLCSICLTCANNYFMTCCWCDC